MYMHMRQSVGSLTEFANITWPANANATLPLSLLFVTSSLGGIPLNFLVLYITFFCHGITGDYKYFLANLAACDFLACFSTLFQLSLHLYHLIGDVPLNVKRCYYMTFTPYLFGFCMASALPLASINRYCVICRDLDEWFTGKRIALLCALTYFPILFPIIDILFASQVVAYCDYCAFNVFTPNNPEWIIVILVPYVYPCLIFCNFSVYKKLAQHMDAARRILGNQLQHERSILKALVIQATIPPILISPIAVIFVTVFLTGFDQDTLLNKVIINFGDNIVLSVMDFCFIAYNLNQTLDALVTLIIVKPYRIAAKEILFNIKRKLVGDQNTASSASVF